MRILAEYQGLKPMAIGLRPVGAIDDVGRDRVQISDSPALKTRRRRRRKYSHVPRAEARSILGG